MNHTPNQIKKMSLVELKGILKFFDNPGKVAFDKFVNKCIEGTKDSIVDFVPSGLGHDIDDFQRGYQKGILKTHELYKGLRSIVENEIENKRKELTPQK